MPVFTVDYREYKTMSLAVNEKIEVELALRNILVAQGQTNYDVLDIKEVEAADG